MYDDYKMDWVEKQNRLQGESVEGWIYIGVSTNHPYIAKIGLTAGKLGTRASSSQNPFYTLLCAFKIKVGISQQIIYQIESTIISELSKHYQRLEHISSSRLSEWFAGNPNEIRENVNHILCDRFLNEMYGFHCDIRNEFIIYSWENKWLCGQNSNNTLGINDWLQYSPFDDEPYLKEPFQIYRKRVNYLASDPNPPRNPDCFMQGGCGDPECGCW